MGEQPKSRSIGRQYDHMKSVKLREVDVERLDRLQELLERDQSAVIREAIRHLAEARGVIIEELRVFVVVDLPDDLRQRMAELRRSLGRKGIGIDLNEPAAPWLSLAYLDPIRLGEARERLEELEDRLEQARPGLPGLPFKIQLTDFHLRRSSDSSRQQERLSLSWDVTRGRPELAQLEAELKWLFPTGSNETRRRSPGWGVWIGHVTPEDEARVWSPLEENKGEPYELTVTPESLKIRVKTGGRLPSHSRLDRWIAKVWPDG